MSVSPLSVGTRLRTVRQRRGLSLQEVQALSGHTFKAAVLGAYERGERAISVERLVRLAELYGVSIAYLLRQDPRGDEIDLTERRASNGEGIAIDAARLRSVEDCEVALVLARHIASVQIQRHEIHDDVLTIRSTDLDLLASVLGQSTEELRNRLDALQLLRPPAQPCHPAGEEATR